MTVEAPAAQNAEIAELRQKLVELRKTVANLQDAHERALKVFEFSNDAIVVFDVASDEIIDVNPRACAMLGYTREELLETPVSAMHPGEMSRFAEFAQGVAEQGHGWTNELTCMTKDQRKLPAEISASVVTLTGRHCLVAMVRDISERRRVELEREQLVAELSEALANVKTLSGLLPICAGCKKMRDEAGRWHPLEQYISERSSAEFTHGLCQPCSEQLYPQLAEED